MIYRLQKKKLYTEKFIEPLTIIDEGFLNCNKVSVQDLDRSVKISSEGITVTGATIKIKGEVK